MVNEFDDEHGQRLLKLCDHVNIVQQIVQDVLPSSSDSDSDKTIAALSDAELAAQWHRDHCIEPVEGDAFEKCFEAHPENKRLISRNRAPKVEAPPSKGRMKRIVTEITSLQSSLPEGIFVRYGSSRPDMMKVMICGPQDTPYEQGLFEFDLTLPSDYPNSPPKMVFRTTGKGRAHFNPNLYADGKVCLSLLGTWSGPAWNASQSTLLQVLVSIQAMVFCSEPWYNEPGRELRESSLQSERYNIEVGVELH